MGQRVFPVVELNEVSALARGISGGACTPVTFILAGTPGYEFLAGPAKPVYIFPTNTRGLTGGQKTFVYRSANTSRIQGPVEPVMEV